MIIWVATTNQNITKHHMMLHAECHTPSLCIMAANIGDLKGYDHQFVEPPNDDLLCLICLCVARDPQQLNCCGKVLCNGCLNEHKKRSNSCPQCREDIVSFADKRSNRDILSLKIRCDNSSNGCEWVGELRSREKHLASCDFALLSCPNKCSKDDKIVKIFRKDMEKHTKEECQRRQHECPHCQEAGEYQERTSTHLEECPMIQVPCPNHGCEVHMVRCKLSNHQQECMFEEVPCRYVSIGCDEKVLRKDLEEHEGDTQKHLQLAIDTVNQQQSMLAKLQSKAMPMIYRFTNYDHHKTADDRIYTPAFYTSPGGYKMCICIIAKGVGEGKGTHVSVGAHLMKGENDHHLPWPFTGTVTFELLNQLEDKNHSHMSIKFSPDNPLSQQIVNKERSALGWGTSCYIRHSNLGYDAILNCQYLKDNCLYFRISVDAESSLKPWLI